MTQGYGQHRPVMVEEAMELLAVKPGGRYCDATVGAGGHARAILERSAPEGRLLGIDRDPEALAHCREALSEFGERLALSHGNFADTCAITRELEWQPVDGVVADLGVSSHQLDTAGRGFSFGAEGPLDMRMDPAERQTAARLIARASEQQLAQIIRDFGEERRCRRLARAIKQAQRAGKLDTTKDLSDVVCRTLGYRRGKIHPATRVFQALRIAVNDELGALRRFLATVFDAVRPGGVVVVIAFHSLEDREVKQAFARLAQPRDVNGRGGQPLVGLLTRKPLRPSSEEARLNPRARSARLRAAEKCA
jgi:16S rRNA (cytosine1402-N4)-methyltransferase